MIKYILGKDVREGKKNAIGGAFYGGSWHDIPQYASGTMNAHGSLFLAGEAGPEIVGHVGGRTEVLNKSQIAALSKIIRRYPNTFAIMDPVGEVVGNFTKRTSDGKEEVSMLDAGDGKTL